MKIIIALIASLAIGLCFSIPATANPIFHPMGLTWDDGDLWVSDYASGAISKIDPFSGTIAFSFSPFGGTGGRVRDLAFDGSILWAAYWSDPTKLDLTRGAIYGFNPLNGSIVSSFLAPFSAFADGLTWDGTTLWIGEEGANGPGAIYRVNPGTDQVISSISGLGECCSNPRGLAWDGHSIWAGYQSVGLIRDHDPFTGSILTTFASPEGQFQQGLAFDGQYLWAAGSVGSEVYRINPLTGQVVFSLDVSTLRVVPEPAALLLFVSGLAALLFSRKQFAS